MPLFLGWTGVNERTFVAVKPDGVQRRLVGEIVRRFEKKGFKLVGLKLVQVFGVFLFSLIHGQVIYIFCVWSEHVSVLCGRRLRIFLGNTTGT